MLSTMTVDELAEKFLGPQLCKAVGRVDIDKQPSSATSHETSSTKSIDDLASEHLSVELVQALSKVDLKGIEFGATIEIQQLRICIRWRGLVVLLLALWTASRITDINPLLHFLMALVNSH